MAFYFLLLPHKYLLMSPFSLLSFLLLHPLFSECLTLVLLSVLRQQGTLSLPSMSTLHRRQWQRGEQHFPAGGCDGAAREARRCEAHPVFGVGSLQDHTRVLKHPCFVASVLHFSFMTNANGKSKPLRVLFPLDLSMQR